MSELESYSPIDGSLIGSLPTTSTAEYNSIVDELQEAFLQWRTVPAPARGLLVRAIGDALRARKSEIAELITLEAGKITAEAEGEVQEAIDVADFAVGLSRQLYGRTMHSERPAHRMYEQWHPLGIVGTITAFNFPVAVWAWNAMIAAVCGDVVLWKPSELTPLVAKLVNDIASKAAADAGYPPIFGLVISAGPELGKEIAADRRIPLVSATGSCRMGRSVAEVVGKRLGKVLLELGGNNACIVLNDADLDLAIRSVAFGAAGTAGQRCTTTRRVLIETDIEESFVSALSSAYKQIKIGDPRQSGVLMGPLIHEQAVQQYKDAISQITAGGGEVVYGGNVLEGMPSGFYVEPTIVKAPCDLPIVMEETFAPILYVISVDGVEDAIQLNNSVAQGLSSAIFTRDIKSAEKFLSAAGSDCGIANVNLGTSGAEIGGAFGGEKDTGGGRESGSDSWKQYMRRQTNTINYGDDLPLAQGIEFDIS